MARIKNVRMFTMFCWGVRAASLQFIFRGACQASRLNNDGRHQALALCTRGATQLGLGLC